MQKTSLSAWLKEPWLFDYLTKADVCPPEGQRDDSVTCSAKHIYVYKHLEGPCADGSLVKEAGDDHLFVRVVFTGNALRNFAESRAHIAETDEDLNFDRSLLLLRKFYLSFKPSGSIAQCSFEIVVTDFVLWGLLDGFVPKTIPTNCMHIAEIQRRSQTLQMQWRVNSQVGENTEESSLGSIALSQLLDQMSHGDCGPQQDNVTQKHKDKPEDSDAKIANPQPSESSNVEVAADVELLEHSSDEVHVEPILIEGSQEGGKKDQVAVVSETEVGESANPPLHRPAAIQKSVEALPQAGLGECPDFSAADEFHVKRILVPASQEEQLKSFEEEIEGDTPVDASAEWSDLPAEALDQNAEAPPVQAGKGVCPPPLKLEELHVKRMLVSVSQEEELGGAWECYSPQPDKKSSQRSSQKMAESPLFKVTPRQPLSQFSDGGSQDDAQLRSSGCDMNSASKDSDDNLVPNQPESVTGGGARSLASSFLAITNTPSSGRSKNKARTIRQQPPTLDCDSDSLETEENNVIGNKNRSVESEIASNMQQRDTASLRKKILKDKDGVKELECAEQAESASVEVQVGCSLMASSRDQTPKRVKAVDIFTEIGDSLQLMSENCLARPASLQTEVTRNHGLMNGHVDSVTDESLMKACRLNEDSGRSLDSTGPFTVQGLAPSQVSARETTQDGTSGHVEQRKTDLIIESNEEMETESEADVQAAPVKVATTESDDHEVKDRETQLESRETAMEQGDRAVRTDGETARPAEIAQPRQLVISQDEYSLASLPDVAESMDSLHLSVSQVASQPVIADEDVMDSLTSPPGRPPSPSKQQRQAENSGSSGAEGMSAEKSISPSNQDGQRIPSSSSLSSQPPDSAPSQFDEFKSPPERQFASTQRDTENMSQAPKPDFPFSQVSSEHDSTSPEDRLQGGDVRSKDADAENNAIGSPSDNFDAEKSPELFETSSSSSAKQSGSSSADDPSSSLNAANAVSTQAEPIAQLLPSFSVSPITQAATQTPSHQKMAANVVDFNLESISIVNESSQAQSVCDENSAPQPNSPLRGSPPTTPPESSERTEQQNLINELASDQNESNVKVVNEKDGPPADFTGLTVLVDDQKGHAFQVVSPSKSAHIVSIVPVSPSRAPARTGQISPPAPPLLSAQLGNPSVVKPLCKEFDGQNAEIVNPSPLRPVCKVLEGQGASDIGGNDAAETDDCDQVVCPEPIVIDIVSPEQPHYSRRTSERETESGSNEAGPSLSAPNLLSDDDQCMITSAHLPSTVNPIMVGDDSQLSVEGDGSQISDPDSMDFIQGIERDILRRESLLLAGELPMTQGSIQVKLEALSPPPQFRPAQIASRSSSTSSTADSVIEAYTTQRRMEALQRKLDNNKSQPLTKQEPVVFNKQKKQTFIGGKVQIVNHKPPAESGIKLLLGAKKKKSLLKQATTGAANKSALQKGKPKRKLYHTESMLLDMDVEETESRSRDKPLSVFAGHTSKLKRNESAPALSSPTHSSKDISAASNSGERLEPAVGQLSKVSSEPVIRATESSSSASLIQGRASESVSDKDTDVTVITYRDVDAVTVSDSCSSQDSIIDITDQVKSQTKKSPLASSSFPVSRQDIIASATRQNDVTDDADLNTSVSDSALPSAGSSFVAEKSMVAEGCDPQEMSSLTVDAAESSSRPSGELIVNQSASDGSTSAQSPVLPKTPTSRSATLPSQPHSANRSPSISSQSSVTSVPLATKMNSSPPLSRRGSVTKVIFMESPQRVRRPTGNSTPPTERTNVDGTPSVKKKARKSLKMMTPVARRKTLDSDSIANSPESQLSLDKIASPSPSKPADKKSKKTPANIPSAKSKKKLSIRQHSTPKDSAQRPKRATASSSKVKLDDMKVMSPRKKQKLADSRSSGESLSANTSQRNVSGNSSLSPLPCYQPVVHSSDSSALLDDTVTFEDLLGRLDEDLTEEQLCMQRFTCPPVFTDTMLSYFQADSYLHSSYD